MKEKITKAIIFILLIILVYKIIGVNAAYKTMVQGNLDSNIQPWVIMVNSVNIAAEEKKSFDLNTIISENENTKTGKIAPGMKFKIPIEIDATETKNMDIRYDIIIDGLDEFEAEIKIEDILEENTNSAIIKTGSNKYTGIITTEQIEQDLTHNIAINLVWENNDEIDTKLGTNEERQKFQIPVTVYVSQYADEEIIEYTEGN